MPYPSAATAANIISAVGVEFRNVPEFKGSSLGDAEYLYWFNEIMDELHHDCYEKPDEFSINTVVGAREYSIDGASLNFPNEMDEIVRVDYNGSPLTYRYDYILDLSAADATTSNGTPDGFYERWDNDKRYLGLSCPPDAVVVLKAYATRQATNLAATSGSPAMERDFWSLLKAMLMVKVGKWCARNCQDLSRRKVLRQDWMDVQALEVNPGKRALARAVKARQGKKAHQQLVKGPQDFYV